MQVSQQSSQTAQLHLVVATEDGRLLQFMKSVFPSQSYELVHAFGATAVATLLDRGDWSLAVLDALEGLGTALFLCRGLKASLPTVPVAVIGAGGTEAWERAAIAAGAADYLSRPLDPKVFSARLLDLHASPSTRIPVVISVGPFFIDCGGRRVLVHGTPILLTTTQYRVLTHLAQNSDQIVSYEEIATIALGNASANGLRLRVRQCVFHLTRRLGPAGNLIVNERSAGYRLKCKRIPNASS
jgi:DNA-binding response OmpR family regulator